MLRGDLEGAKTLYSRVLETSEQTRGPEHYQVALTLSSLGALHEAAGEYDAARGHYERALAIDEKVFGAAHPRVAVDLMRLAIVSARRGDLAAARTLHARGHEINETAGVDGFLDPLLQEASYAAVTGDRASALSYLRRAVDGGFSDIELLRGRDSYFAPLQGDAAFQRILADVQARIRAHQPDRPQAS
jgi:tetratricopeptide (TPR) repeat protein